MLPKEDENCIIIGIAPSNFTGRYLNGDNKEITFTKNFMEIETCYFKKTNSLCIQTHPDWYIDIGIKIFGGYLLKLLNKEVISPQDTLQRNYRITRRIPIERIQLKKN